MVEWQKSFLQSSVLLTPSSAAAELTDTGRLTTLELGQSLRQLYVQQLGFLPERITDARMIYLRSSPFSRTLDSLLQVFGGLYPVENRGGTVARPIIVTRELQDETLMPNEEFCERFIQLSRAFLKRAVTLLSTKMIII